MNHNHYLDRVCRTLHEGRLAFPDSSDFTLHVERHPTNGSVEIWFRTRGCRHSHIGGCTMCNYWISAPVDPEQMIASVRTALKTIDFHPALLMVNPFGSMFDEWEVPNEARREIFRLLSNFPQTSLVFETRADTVNETKMFECAKILEGHYVAIELGLESADPWIREFCINKAISTTEVLNAVQIIRESGLLPVANILVGTPFLSYSQMVEDAVSSINWAFEHGFERCVIFPLNIKPWTLVKKLEELGLYSQPPLWALVDVLIQLNPRLLDYTEVVWYSTPKLVNPDYQIPCRNPTTCPKCHSSMINIFDAYQANDARGKIVQQLSHLQCYCRQAWQNQLVSVSNSNLTLRVKDAYKIIGENIFGIKWWQENGENIFANIPDWKSRVPDRGVK